MGFGFRVWSVPHCGSQRLRPVQPVMRARASRWDSLLLEVGFLAILLAPFDERPVHASGPSRVALWMLRFVLFKLMLMSGVVKITSGDRVWLHLTALEYHLASQVQPHTTYHKPASPRSYSGGALQHLRNTGHDTCARDSRSSGAMF
jgi:hypothetical protein